jgi:putative addiction module component (TIGR02574 family)
MKAADIPQLQSLTVQEKLQLVEELWSEIIRQPDKITVPAWHVAELQKDYPAYQANPQEGSPWAEVKAQFLRDK